MYMYMFILFSSLLTVNRDYVFYIYTYPLLEPSFYCRAARKIPSAFSDVWLEAFIELANHIARKSKRVSVQHVTLDHVKYVLL